MLNDLTPQAHQVLATDKGYRSTALEADLSAAGITMLRPATRNETPRPGATALKKIHQTIESIFDTLKDKLDIEHHHGRPMAGPAARITQHILALTTTIWHNDLNDNPVLPSPTPYDPNPPPRNQSSRAQEADRSDLGAGSTSRISGPECRDIRYFSAHACQGWQAHSTHC